MNKQTLFILADSATSLAVKSVLGTIIYEFLLIPQLYCKYSNSEGEFLFQNYIVPL